MKSLYKLVDIKNIKRISFRDDINGLRAIAVSSVVFYHADLDLFKGGWLGVDVFFVISGYLISNIIISELNENKFSLREFYKRRAIRILPALFSTMLFTVPLAYWLLTPKALDEYLKSKISSTFFFSNFYFQNLDFYVAESTKYMPFLHTWSLAIEEQFYILFPIITIFIYKKINKKFFLIFFSFIFLGSIYLNLITQEIIKFYQLQFRVWELLLGVIIMILSFNIKINHLEKIGLPLLLIPIFYFDDSWINDIEPKLTALIGISLIIFSNKEGTFVSSILNKKVFILIGLSSYSIYLLHQPIFAFSRIYFTQKAWKNLNDIYLSEGEIFIALSLTFFLGYLNYFFIEKYFLKRKKLLYIFILFTAVLSLDLFLKFNDSREVVYSNKLYEYTVNLENFTPTYDGRLCHDIEKLEDICSFNVEKKQKIILLGDSHARELGYLLSKSLNNYNFEIITGNSCLFLLNKEFYKTCPLKKDEGKVKEYVKSIEGGIFIYVGDIWDNSYDSLDIVKNIPITFNELINKNNYIISIDQIPVFPYSVPEKINDVRSQGFIGFEHTLWKQQKDTKPKLKVYENYKSSYFSLIKPEEYICDNILENYCVGAINEYLYYRDDNHLTVDGFGLFLNQLINKINEIKQ